MNEVTVKISQVQPWDVAKVHVKKHKLSPTARKYKRNHVSIPHPLIGQPLMQIMFFGPHGGLKEIATLTEAQAKEVASALLLVAGGESEQPSAA